MATRPGSRTPRPRRRTESTTEYTAVVIATPIASERIAKTVKSGVAPSRLRASLMSLTTRAPSGLSKRFRVVDDAVLVADEGEAARVGRVLDHEPVAGLGRLERELPPREDVLHRIQRDAADDVV